MNTPLASRQPAHTARVIARPPAPSDGSDDSDGLVRVVGKGDGCDGLVRVVGKGDGCDGLVRVVGKGDDSDDYDNIDDNGDDSDGMVRVVGKGDDSNRDPASTTHLGTSARSAALYSARDGGRGFGLT